MIRMMFGDAKVTSPRRLSVNEAKMMTRSADAIRHMHPSASGKALSMMLGSALSAILCNDRHWSEMAQRSRMRVSSAPKGSKRRTAALLEYEGMVIGMVEVMDIRYDMHDGRAIADAIDDATRPVEFEMLDGFVSSSSAYDIIVRAYSSRNGGTGTNQVGV